MDLDPAAATASLHIAIDQLVAVVDRVTDDELNERPHGDHTNAIGALVVHCCAVCEFWLGHVGLGRPSDRDRDAEFSTAVPRSEALKRLAATRRQVEADLAALGAGEGRPHELRGVLPADGCDDAVVLHVVEELFQHLGHAELTADALITRRPA